MVIFKTKIGARGQMVIPKIIRESLGFMENSTVLLQVEDKSVRLLPRPEKEILPSWAEIARKEGTNVTQKFTYGDRLYEDLFSK